MLKCFNQWFCNHDEIHIKSQLRLYPNNGRMLSMKKRCAYCDKSFPIQPFEFNLQMAMFEEKIPHSPLLNGFLEQGHIHIMEDTEVIKR